MNYLIILVTYLAFASADYNLALSDEQMALAIQYGNECILRWNITKSQAFQLRDGKLHNPNTRIKCFANCFLEQAGFFEDGQVKPDVVLAKLGPIAGVDEVKAAQAKCDSIKGIGNCDTAFKVYECYHNYDTYQRALKIIKDLNLPLVD